MEDNDAFLQALDRMAFLLVALKARFDHYAVLSGMLPVNPQTVSALLLDLLLSLSPAELSRSCQLARCALPGSTPSGSVRVGEVGIDFRAFLCSIYLPAANLLRPVKNDESAPLGDGGNARERTCWIPGPDGRWIAVHAKDMQRLERAMATLQRSSGSGEEIANKGRVSRIQSVRSVFRLPALPSTSSEEMETYTIREDLVDVLLLAGVGEASEESVSRTLEALRHLLPGGTAGPFTLQEMATLRHHLLLSSGSAPRTSSTGSAALSRGFRLPWRGDHAVRKPEEVRAEFNRLDLLGEGRLTYLPLRSALTLAEVEDMEEEDLREWLRRHDRQQKGFVDIEDYIAIYGSTLSSTSSAPPSISSSPRASLPKQIAPSEETAKAGRLEVLRVAFKRYDVDGDGFISAVDLMQSLGRAGDGEDRSAPLSQRDCVAWISRRDRSGLGGKLCFEDFAAFYL